MSAARALSDGARTPPAHLEETVLATPRYLATVNRLSAAEQREPTADVVRWLLGRGAGEGLRCSADQLPLLGKWAKT